MNRLEQIFLHTASLGASLLETLGIFSLLQKTQHNRVIVLMYHGITATKDPILHFDHKHVHKEKFEAQLLYLKKKYALIGLKDFIEWKHGQKNLKNAVLLTFDDGYKNCYTQLFPLLNKYNVPAIIFLPTAYIGKDTVAWYDAMAWYIKNTTKETMICDTKILPIRSQEEKIHALIALKQILHRNPEKRSFLLKQITKQLNIEKKCHEEDLCFLSWSECKEMQKNGVTFGSHSVTHPDMTAIDKTSAQKEYTLSKRKIETMLKTDCTTFAYPFGKMNLRLQQQLQDAGYFFGFTVSYGKNTKETKNVSLKRISINNIYPTPLFALTLFVNFPSFHHWLLKKYSQGKGVLDAIMTLVL